VNVKGLIEETSREVLKIMAYADNFVLGATLETLQKVYPRIQERDKPIGCIFENRPTNSI
jgi:hypothetical protein